MAAPSPSAATRARQGADDVPALPSEIKARLAADRLEARLFRENLRSYAEVLSRHAQALGSTKTIRPRDVRDAQALRMLKDRARVSARSVVATQQDRRAALVEQTGSKSAARAPFKEWAAGQGERIAAFEAGQTAHQASDDFVSKNGLAGVEHLEPKEAAVPDECQDAIDAGDVPIGQLGSFPSHVNCPHFAVRTFDESSIPPLDGLWTGQDLGGIDAG